MWLYVLMARDCWHFLSPDDKERYKKQARGFADRGRKTLEAHRRRGRTYLSGSERPSHRRASLDRMQVCPSLTRNSDGAYHGFR